MPPSQRQARESDIAALEIVRRQAVEYNFSDVYERNDFADLVAMDENQLSNWIRSEKIIVTMIETPVTPISYGAADQSEGKILGLYTAPDYEREGWGSQILDFLESKITSWGSVNTIRVHIPLCSLDFFKDRNYTIKGTDCWRGLDVRIGEKQVKTQD